MSRNPYDFGPGADPIQTGNFDAAIAAWRDHRDKILHETIPQVDKAIGAVQSLATTLDAVVDLVATVLPAIQTAGVGQAKEARQAAGDCTTSLCKLRAALPGLLGSIDHALTMGAT